MNSYLIIGTSRYLIDEEINKINKNNLVINKFNLDEDSINDIIDDASYLTLFSEKKLVIINNANIFNTKNLTEKEYEHIIKFLNSTDNIVVFISDKIDGKKRISKYFQDNKKIILQKKYYEKDLIEKVINKFKKIDKNIDYKTAQYIVKSCINNYDLIMNEIEKIEIFYSNESTIIYEDVVNLVGKTIDDNVYNFTNALIDRNKKLVFSLFDELLLLNVDPIYIISIISNQYRNMYKIKSYIDNGINEKEISSSIKLFGYAFTKAVENSYKYTKEELSKFLLELAKMDISIKSGLCDKEILLNNFILNI